MCVWPWATYVTLLWVMTMLTLYVDMIFLMALAAITLRMVSLTICTPVWHKFLKFFKSPRMQVRIYLHIYDDGDQALHTPLLCPTSVDPRNLTVNDWRKPSFPSSELLESANASRACTLSVLVDSLLHLE